LTSKQEKPLFIVHHLNNSRSQRVLWLLEELGFEYAIRFYERNKDMTAPAELKLVHPLGKSPVLEDLDAEGGAVTLVETGAICEYLAGKAGGKFGCPIDPREAISYRQFLHYAEGSVMPILFASLVVSKMPLIGRYGAKRLRPMLNVHLDFIENVLAQRTWFAGESLTAADVMMSFPLEAARSRGLVGSDKPATIDWLRRIHARPAYQRALSKGGAYAFVPTQDRNSVPMPASCQPNNWRRPRDPHRHRSQQHPQVEQRRSLVHGLHA
jgi:glutathione S-transferase